MAYFGKQFVVDREVDYDAFIRSLEIPPEMTAKYLSYKPTTKLEKDGDKYTITTITPEGTRVTTFTSGVEFDDAITPAITVKSKYTVDGDTVTQEISKDGKTATFKREYSDNELKVTITGTFFDGIAYRYYKPL